MRLLYYGKGGELKVTADLVDAGTVPPYAVLSHTWGADDEEVTFEDLARNVGKDKPGYKKIELCGDQANRDGLQYFWIDTCCINKANNAELSLAIRSMFRWYRNASRCYVYLLDVPASPLSAGEEAQLPPWNTDFRQSKWFTRGWTLQELLAPSVVEFFSHEWHKLGDRASLKQLIYEATTIPCGVLEGAPLSQFSIDERFRWRQSRVTKLKEDAAYCLFGILDVDMAPVYGEGTEEAFGRLHGELRKQEDCLRDLRPTDPRDDKKRIEDTKGGLSEALYRWVLENSIFRQWYNDPQSQLLWINGDPGKGKTMLLCGVIDELQSTLAKTASVSYFFCQATDSRINNAVAVLRGLLYLLIIQQPPLIAHVRKKYDQAGRGMFEDTNAWVALTDIFANILQELYDSNSGTTYMLIDGLDECIVDRVKLLQLISRQSSTSSRVKWIGTSRNWPDIEAHLRNGAHKLSLELNVESVRVAVELYVEQKVDQLAQARHYNAELRSAVLQHMTSNAEGTFLWVSLVCQDLQTTSRWNVLKKLALFPPGLDSLYKRMMHQISKSDDAEVCQQVLSIAAVLYRPVTIHELTVLVESLEYLGIHDVDQLMELVKDGRRFIMYHKGAIESYPLQTYASALLFSPTGSMIRRLFQHEESEQIIIKPAMCVSWSACLQTLERHGDNVNCVTFSHDSTKLVSASADYTLMLWDVISGACLQTLTGHSANVSSAAFSHDSSELISASWDNTVKLWRASDGVCLRTFTGHKDYVWPVAYSHDSTWLASASDDKTVKIWNATTSVCLWTLRASYDMTIKIWEASSAFSYDSTRLASASIDKTVKIWNVTEGTCLQTLKGHSDKVSSVAFSRDMTKLASASHDKTVKIWDMSSGVCMQTLKGHSNIVRSIAFSHSSTQLASASFDRTVKIWDISSSVRLPSIGFS
ncbi:hypothetical protein E8E11_010024 [Didymella keratinophila]|nr:hypothetical protein E8E11_010024 [Didymella keratinophila]